MITLTINGKRVKAEENATLLDVTRKMSLPIPTLCYHPDLTPQGACRLCTVEVREDGKSRLVTACNYPVRKGIEVRTHTKRVLRARQVLIELLFARCPEAPFVQGLARQFGIKKRRFKTENPHDDCILCGLCVRTCDEIVGAMAIDFSNRGVQKQVGTPFNIDSESCVACGACEYICPTGAIKMEMERVRKIKRSDTGTHRYCRYMRLGLVDFMICSNGFECWRCEFDQMMEDRFDTHPAFAIKPAKSKRPLQISGFTFYPNLYYSDSHVWAKPMDQLIRLGLDDLVSPFAADAHALELPAVGRVLKKNEVLVKVVVGKQKLALLSPFRGTVSTVNQDIAEDPALAWKAPYDRGWLVMMEVHRPEDLSKLYSGQLAQDWFAQQAVRLTTRLTEWAARAGSGGAESTATLSFEDAQLIREVVRNRWDEMKKILFNDRSKR